MYNSLKIVSAEICCSDIDHDIGLSGRQGGKQVAKTGNLMELTTYMDSIQYLCCLGGIQLMIPPPLYYVNSHCMISGNMLLMNI